MSEIVAMSVEPLDLPLAEPFEISLGTQHEASNVLVTVETADGTTGYGDGSPLPPVTGETQAIAIEAAQAMASIVEGCLTSNYRPIIQAVRQTFPKTPSATFAVETAILDAYCREHEIPLSELFGSTPRPVETDMTIPLLPQSEATKRATSAANSGYEHLKIKTGNDVSEDVERVSAIHDAVPDAALKIDANQGWTPKETAWFADRVADRGVHLELIEQPVPATDVTGLADTRRRVDVPIAADETVFTPEDAIRVVTEDAADIINVKLGKSGPLATADIIAIAQGADTDLMIGCMLESAIGIHTSAHIVAGTDAFSYVDLDGNRLLAEDIIPTSDGPIHEIAGPGHGVTPGL
ncbi:dipeptide epimerase [Haladaptatus sp. W1]|uniref:dipeptide epimerase n=1 Tax=Haladaptatus sp. W1 TaxID=1897478 RepID=UPI0008499919|nr:dipeptide epimerase [Haladaptatus sp. W1]ODR80223.1 dipeptide epimerase [Haladaptatus sp. W1]